MKIEQASMASRILTGPEGLPARYGFFYRNSDVSCPPNGQRRDVTAETWIDARQGVLTDGTLNRLIWRDNPLLAQGMDLIVDFGVPVAIDRVVLDAHMPSDVVFTLGEVSLYTAVRDMDRFDLARRCTDVAARPVVFDNVGRQGRYLKVHIRPVGTGGTMLTGLDVVGSTIETVEVDPSDWRIYPTPDSVTTRAGRFNLGDARLSVGRSVPAAKQLEALYSEKLSPGRAARTIVLQRRRMPAEHYRIAVSPQRVRVEANDMRGFVWALQTLLCLRDADGPTIRCGTIADGPGSRLRGVHMYLPAVENIEFAKQFIDEVVVRSKLNTVFLELGGGMEFKRHPEINEGWAEFCRQQVEHRGVWPTASRGESQYRATRDSLHVELAGGTWLTQDQVRDLAGFMRSRGLEVIPEVQSLSHSYWLLASHPELAEFPDALFPFTYCPSNPETYKVLFDCIDEVVDVFKPKRVHIGHDEIYELAHCPRCRDKRGEDLLAADVCKIHSHLKHRGVGTMMWGDHLIRKHNGLERRVLQLWQKIHRDAVATYRAIDKLPKDIAITNWSWGIDPDSKASLMEHGLAHAYGNLHAIRMPDWPKRRANRLDLGGAVSTWTGVSQWELGYDGLFQRIIMAGQVLWGPWTQADVAIHERVVSDRVAVLKQRFSPHEAVKTTGTPLPLPPSQRVALSNDLPFSAGLACGPIRFAPNVDRPVGLGRNRRVVLARDFRARGVHLLLASGEPQTYRTTADTYGQPVSLEMGRVVVEFGDGTRRELVLRYGVHLANLWSHPLTGGPWCYEAEPAYRAARSILYATPMTWSSRKVVRRLTLYGTREPLDNTLLLLGLTRVE